MKSRQFRLGLLGLALGVLIALSLAPQTRWLVRLQALTTLRLYHPFPNSMGQSAQSYMLSPADDTKQMQGVLARHPDDFTLRYAQATEGIDSRQITARLRALEPRFPAEPRFYAGLLRYAVVDLHWNRFEEYHDLPQADLPPPIVPTAPETLAAYDRDAATGERLDPDNAYFPIMRAIGLFAAKRDTEAQAAVERAAHESGWREYIPAEVEVRWRLHEEAFGDPGAFPRSNIAFTTLLPQYAKQRALARLLLYQAIQEEQAGRWEEGLKRREALRHVAVLMRTQSTSLIGSLLATTIILIAESHPGGVKPPKTPPGMTKEQVMQRRLDAWTAYVTHLGHPELAARARADAEASRQILAVASHLETDNLTGPLFRLGAWWLSGLAVLTNCAWLLLLGGLAAGLARVREAKPLPPGTVGGFWTALLPSLAMLTLLLDPPQAPGELNLADEILMPLTILILIPLAGFSMGAIFLPRLRRRILFGIGAALVTLVTVTVFGLLAAWQTHGSGELWTELQRITSASNDESTANTQAAQLDNLLAGMTLSLAVPILLLFVSSIAARVRRVPVSVGLIRSVRTAALPLVCLLVLIWGGILLGTVHQEQIVNGRVGHMVQDEGPYTAARAGLPWPGATR
jgi:hypothetical protein